MFVTVPSITTEFAAHMKLEKETARYVDLFKDHVSGCICGKHSDFASGLVEVAGGRDGGRFSNRSSMLL